MQGKTRSTNSPPRDGPGIDWGDSKLYFRGKFIAGSICLLLIVLFCIIGATNDFAAVVIGGVTSVLGMIAGLLFSPIPKPVDHSHTAHVSVERLLDLHTKVGRMRGQVTHSIQQAGEDGLLVLRLVGLQDSFVDQEELLHRSVTDWAEVSPGVVDRVEAKRSVGVRIFEERAKESNHER